MEVHASLRLFGGKRALRERVRDEAAELGVGQVSSASTSLAALAFARAGVDNGFARPLQEGLDRLPMEVLSAVEPHRDTLARLGCKTLGDIRKLPRGGVSRRFDKKLLTALDQAYGLRPEGLQWEVLPETFKTRLELMSRVELAPALMCGARRLLLQMCGWLAARHCGASAFTLRWAHDAMRARSAGDGGELTVRTGEPTRNVEHLSRLLNEHLAKTELLAPVGDLELEAIEVRSLEPASASLLPDTLQQGESLREVLERIAARLGPERVLRPVLTEDHRLEWMQFWQPASGKPPRERAASDGMPQPTWVLPQPLKLATQDHRPMYQGVLHLIAGPHRVEGGWWHRIDTADGADTAHVQRDYFVALSEHAGVLWVFQERLANDHTAWYLHGVFA
ncbi:DNA polymerase Y family protein [Schlegelella sp. S2-27]|uniref:DNA polymerase Y family protein n=1 Tax=Caldimonas mangrovi TaxID=2944811 RepID=A0ABT0YPH6_9BURK|nr:DNA polymerase Y family protein [Caldimonas mangrovi]MCM5680056.1 DNA polymerase Y family protein [Caldimonas mangrovi]